MTGERITLSAEQMKAPGWHYDPRVDRIADTNEAREQADLDASRREQVEVLRGEYERITTEYQQDGDSESLLLELRNLSEMVDGLTDEYKAHRSQVLAQKEMKASERALAAAHLDYTSLKDLQALTDKINGIVGAVSGEAAAQKTPLDLASTDDKGPHESEKLEETTVPTPTAETPEPEQAAPPAVEPEEKDEKKPEEKPPFQPEQVKVKGEDGQERLLTPEELTWWRPGKTIECISGWENIGSVDKGGIDNGSHFFRLDSGSGELVIRAADVPATDKGSKIDERFLPRSLGTIESAQVWTSEWSDSRPDDETRRDEYEVVIRTADGHEYRFVSTESKMSREQARAMQAEQDSQRRKNAEADEAKKTEAIQNHENEPVMAELLKIKEDLHQISEAATIGLRDDGSSRLDESSFDSLHREIRRSVLQRRLKEVTAALDGDVSEDRHNELAAKQAAIQKELEKLNADGIALKFGEIKDNDGNVILEARGYQDYREALMGEIKARSTQLERYAQRANKKDGLKPYEMYAFEQARKALDEAISVQLEYEAIAEYDRYQAQINDTSKETITYKGSDNKDVTVDLHSDEEGKNGQKLSLQGKLDELGVQIAAAQDFITQIEQNPNARYDKQTVAEVKKRRELIKAKNKQAEQIREVMRQLEEKARNLMTLRQIFYLQAHGRVEEEDAANSEMGITYDVSNGNNEFYSYALTVALGSSGIQDQLKEKDSTLDADGLADILIGRMTQIHTDAERESARGSGVARAVNSLRTLDLSSTFIDKAYYGIMGNDGVFSHKLTSEMIMMSGAQLLQAKRKALEALRYRAGDVAGSSGESIDDQENKRGPKLKTAEENWAAADVEFVVPVMKARDNFRTQDEKYPSPFDSSDPPVGYESMNQALARGKKAEGEAKRRQEALEQAQREIDSALAGRQEKLQPYRAEVDNYREDVFTKYDRLVSEWEKDKEALRKKVSDVQDKINNAQKELEKTQNKLRLDLEDLRQKGVGASSKQYKEIADAQARVLNEAKEKENEQRQNLEKLLEERKQLQPEQLESGFTFLDWLRKTGKEKQLNLQELKLLKPYLDAMGAANQAFQTQRKFIAKVQSTWLFTVVGSFNNSKMSLTSGTNDMRSFFGRLDQTSHLRPDGVSNPEVMKYNDLWNKNFGTGKFDAETQRYLGENGDLQRIVAMCALELRNPRSKYWAGNSDLSQSDGVRKLVDEMFDTYCNTEGRETIGQMSKEQREFDKQLVLIKIARDDLVRKYAVEAYGVWFTALKNKQWDKLTDSGVLMALTYGLVRGKNGNMRSMLDFVNLDEIIVKIQEQIDKYYPEESSEDKKQYEDLQGKIDTEEQRLREAKTDEERLRVEEEINKLRRSIGDLGKRYDQLSSLELLKSRITDHREYLQAAYPYGTLEQRREMHDQALDNKRQNEAMIRKELEESQENRPGLMKRIWRSLIGSETQPPVAQQAVKYQYVYSKEDYIKTFITPYKPDATQEQIDQLVEDARKRKAVHDGPTTRKIAGSSDEPKEVQTRKLELKPVVIDLKTDYSYKPLEFSHDAVTMDAFLNQPPEGRQAAADWLDAHDAFGDIIATCSSSVDKALIEDPEKLVEAMNKINTNFSRIASIAMDNSDANMATLPGSDVRYNYMREMAEAAYCGWIENVLHLVGGERPRRTVKDGKLTSEAQKYASDYQAILNVIKDALGDLGSNSRNKAIYNEQIHRILDLNSEYYIGPEHDLDGRDPYADAAFAFRYKRFLAGRAIQYLVVEAGRKKGYRDAHGNMFATWNDRLKIMELNGKEFPQDIIQRLSSPLSDSDG